MSGAVPSAARRFDPARASAELLERARSLAAEAAATGVDEHEVYASFEEKIAVRFEKGDMKLVQVDEGSSLGLRVFQGGRLGFSSTNQADAAALARTAADAAALARVNPPDPANRLPRIGAAATPLRLVHAELLELEIERAVELARAFVDRAAAKDPRLVVEQVELNVSRGTRAIATSGGLALAEPDASVSFSIVGMAVDGEEVGGFHYTGDLVRELRALEPALAACADDFATVVLENLGAGAAESYRGPVLFSPDAFLEVFLAPLCAAASATAVQRGRSALAGRLGERVGAPLLTIADDPTDATLAGAGAFDREGVAAGRYPLVEAGVLRGFLYDAYAANVEGRASTGHAAGGARSLPTVGVHALRVEPGEGGGFEALAERLQKGLFVRRFSGTVDPASGDFSGVAKSSRWIEGGRPVRSVRETMLSGNAFELLRQIQALGSTSERVMGAARVPYALVEGLSVTAG